MFSFIYGPQPPWLFPILTCVECFRLCFFFSSMVPIFQAVFYHILSMDPVWTVCKKRKHCVGTLFLLVICHRNDIAQERNTKHLYLFYDISLYSFYISLYFYDISMKFAYISLYFYYICHGNDIAEEKNTKHLYLFYTPYGFYLQFSSIQLQLLLDNDLLFEI